MLSKPLKSAKSLFNYEYANVAVVFFYLLLVAAWIFSPAKLQYFGSTMVLLANVIFLNTIHILFQYWLLEKSDSYRSMVSNNIDIRSISLKMMALSAVLFFVLFAIKSNDTLTIYLRVFVVGWASLHAFGQTYGLYCAKRLAAAPAKADLKDIPALKRFVYFAIFTQLFLVIESKADFFSAPVEQIIFYGLAAAVFIWVGLVAAYVLRQPGTSPKLNWMFARFFMIGLSCINPVAFFALLAIHGAEYLDVVQKVRSRTKLNEGRISFWALFVLALLMLATFEIYFFVFNPARDSLTAKLMTTFGLTLTMVHYMYDTFAYKMKSAESREKLVELLH